MRIYTRAGDDGRTSLLNERVPKDDQRVVALGEVDEVLAAIDRSLLMLRPIPEELERAQILLPLIARSIAGATGEPARPEDVEALENSMDRMQLIISPTFASFQTEVACALNEIRVRCRALERSCTPLLRDQRLDPAAYAYLNRLGDYLFCLAYRHNQPV